MLHSAHDQDYCPAGAAQRQGSGDRRGGCPQLRPQIVAAVAELGRSHRTRITDLLIAATAHANRLRLYTRNPLDFGGLGGLIEMIVI